MARYPRPLRARPDGRTAERARGRGAAWGPRPFHLPAALPGDFAGAPPRPRARDEKHLAAALRCAAERALAARLPDAPPALHAALCADLLREAAGVLQSGEVDPPRAWSQRAADRAPVQFPTLVPEPQEPAEPEVDREAEREEELARVVLARLGGEDALGQAGLARDLVALTLGVYRRDRRGALAERAAARAQRIDVLERRAAKLTRSLAEVRAVVERVRANPDAEDGVASIYRRVQGLEEEDAWAGAKRDMLATIFRANLELQRRRAAG